MSLDSVDDLEHAEETMHALADALHSLQHLAEGVRLAVGGTLDRFAPDAILHVPTSPILEHTAKLLDEWASYCRPTCGMDGEPHDPAEADARTSGDSDCGCPCHDRPEATG